MSLFTEEIKKIDTMDFQVFLENAFTRAPASFKEDEELINYTKKIFKVVEGMLDMDNVEGVMRHIILSGVLISDLAQNEEGEYKGTHPFLVRPMLKELPESILPQYFDAVMKIVESHEGEKTLINDLKPKPGSAEHLVAIAHAVVKLDCVTIS